LLFCIYAVEKIPSFEYFRDRWQDLAAKNGLPGFYFVAIGSNPSLIDSGNYQLCDAVNLDLRFSMLTSAFKRRMSYFIPFPVNVHNYSSATKKWIHPVFKKPKVYPTIFPNWDNSPRVGKSALILKNSTPEYFKEHVKETIDQIAHKDYG